MMARQPESGAVIAGKPHVWILDSPEIFPEAFPEWVSLHRSGAGGFTDFPVDAVDRGLILSSDAGLLRSFPRAKKLSIFQVFDGPPSGMDWDFFISRGFDGVIHPALCGNPAVIHVLLERVFRPVDVLLSGDHLFEVLYRSRLRDHHAREECVSRYREALASRDPDERVLLRLVLEELINNALLHAFAPAGRTYTPARFRLHEGDEINVGFGVSSSLAVVEVSDSAGMLTQKLVRLALKKSFSRAGLQAGSGRGLLISLVAGQLLSVKCRPGRSTSMLVAHGFPLRRGEGWALDLAFRSPPR